MKTGKSNDLGKSNYLEKYEDVNDVELVGLVRKGNPDAIEALRVRYAEKVLARLKTKLKPSLGRSGLDLSGLRNSAFNGFIKAVGKLDFTPEQEHIVRLLMQIVKCKAAEFGRKKNREFTSHSESQVEFFSSIPSDLDVPASAYETRLDDLLDEIIAEFPQKARRVLYFYIESPSTRSEEEIAALCNDAPEFVATVIRSFKKRLKSHLSQSRMRRAKRGKVDGPKL